MPSLFQAIGGNAEDQIIRLKGTPHDRKVKKRAPNQVELRIPEPFLFFITDSARFKVVHGGRGSGKSWGIADALILKAHTEEHLILCTREYQNSIADSVHRVISNRIYKHGLDPWFDIQQKSIRSLVTGTEFIFKGLHHKIAEIKSTEGVTICWVEEAQSVAEYSWQTLIPTIRGKEGAEIWVSYNPYLEDDPTSRRFQGKDIDPRAIIKEVNWEHNPWFPPDMEQDRLILLKQDPDAYEHVYNGKFLQISEATIFRNNYEVCTFDTPNDGTIDRFFFGMDFGFADDPSFVTRSFIRDNCLYIDYEAYGLHVELDDLEYLMRGGLAQKNGMLYPSIPGIGDWPIKADNSRPETISYLLRRGFNISAAEKWPGSVEDGITHLKGFTKIYIHERCPRMAQEARLYKYKVDKQSGDILPVPMDKHNHGWDSIRYALDGYIMARGGLGVWMKLAG